MVQQRLWGRTSGRVMNGFEDPTEQLREDFRGTVSNSVLDGALEVDEDLSSLCNTFDSRGEVIILESDVSHTWFMTAGALTKKNHLRGFL